jgi:hypothetical protein
MKFNRVALTVFALLDAVLLGRNLKTFIYVGFHGQLQFFWLLFALDAARVVFLLSLAASAFGLAMERRWGMLLSYIQFPVRFVFLYLSFGFLATMPCLISATYGQTPVLIVAMILESFRLFVTVAIHIRSRRSSRHPEKVVESSV